jgi:release factor glutamine methyltransferase
MIPVLKRVLEGKRISQINGFYVATDPVEYDKPDQVFPLHPENQFYLDELVEDKIHSAKALEIGIGSGVLSIGAVKAGAERVTALEINPRAKNYAGFNVVMNGLEDRVEIRDGDTEDFFRPVEGEKFDYVILNPPFEPTPPGIDYFLHSSGGIYGLDFVESTFKDLDKYLSKEGHAQIVTFAPGDENNPFMLVNLVDEYLSGNTTIRVNPVPMRFDDFVDRFVDIGQATSDQVQAMKNKASQDGVTHLYLCMVHYERGEKSLTVKPTSRVYQNWDLPLDSDVPMGWKEK